MSGLRQTDCWRGGRTALCTAMLATLLGCRAPQPRATVQGPAPAPLPALHQDDDSYDWHDLVIAPFGSALKDIPMELHEVLLFRDEAHSGAAVDDAECYGADATPPRFVGRTPDEYMLCFKQDRLSRIQASVRLTKAQAPEVFAAACAAWLKHAALATTVAGGSGAEVQSVDACEGRDGAILIVGTGSAGLAVVGGRRITVGGWGAEIGDARPPLETPVASARPSSPPTRNPSKRWAPAPC